MMQPINKKITTDELKEYLKSIVDMEKNIYIQKQIIQKVQKEMETLGIAKKIREPKEPDHNESGSAEVGLLCLLIFGMVLCLFGFKNAKPGEIVLLILTILMLLIVSIVLASNRSQKIWASKARYQEKMDEHRSKVEADKRRVERELECKRYLWSELQRLKEVNASTEELLARAYGFNIIYPKYQNLIMVCSLYESICAGKCDSLEGRDGAYNILEIEIRLDKIITQLDAINVNLNAIRNNQYMLYSKIEESNNVSNKILNSVYDMVDNLNNITEENQRLNEQMEEIKKNSLISAYCAEQTQRELHYANRMNYLLGKYDSVFDNMPPN